MTTYITVIFCMLIALGIGISVGLRMMDSSGKTKSPAMPPGGQLVTMCPKYMADLEKQLEEETTEWLWKALSRGVGYRVWRSDPKYIRNDGGIEIQHRFAIIAPGQQAPGPGMLFSWSDPDPTDVPPLEAR